MQKQSERLSNITDVIQEVMREYPMTFEGETNPFISTIKAPDIVTCGTRYDLQSNATWQTESTPILMAQLVLLGLKVKLTLTLHY